MVQDGPVNDFLFTYLDSIDEQLLEYLDEDEELKLDAVKRLRFYTSALLEGSISPDHVLEDWPDWYHLVPALVATYSPKVQVRDSASPALAGAALSTRPSVLTVHGLEQRPARFAAVLAAHVLTALLDRGDRPPHNEQRDYHDEEDGECSSRTQPFLTGAAPSGEPATPSRS